MRNKDVEGSGRKLTEFVNLYFEPRNAMMYRLVCNKGASKLAILQITPSVMHQPGVFFTDRNAATYNAQFYSEPKDLKHIDAKILKHEYWTDSTDTKQRMMAELLVPDAIGAEHIIKVMTFGSAIPEDTKLILQQKNIEITHEPYKFFRPYFRKKISQNIYISEGDMFFSSMQTFVISVNTKGVMGKGLASRTKYQFPDAYVRYQDDCKSNKLKLGKPTLYKRATRIEEELADDSRLLSPEKLNGARWFLFLATKGHWREDSKLENIEPSMQWLLKNYQRQGIKSLALPALGCGLGNLPWHVVGSMMCYYLQQMTITSVIYLPMGQAIDEEHKTPEFLLNTYTSTHITTP